MRQIILADVAKYGGDGSGMVEWARLATPAEQETPAPELTMRLPVALVFWVVVATVVSVVSAKAGAASNAATAAESIRTRLFKSNLL